MAIITLKNITSAPVHVRDLYDTLEPGETLEVIRPLASLDGMLGLQQVMNDAKIRLVSIEPQKSDSFGSRYISLGTPHMNIGGLVAGGLINVTTEIPVNIQPDVGRTLEVHGYTTNPDPTWGGGPVTVEGFDQFNLPLRETFNLVGTHPRVRTAACYQTVSRVYCTQLGPTGQQVQLSTTPVFTETGIGKSYLAVPYRILKNTPFRLDSGGVFYAPEEVNFDIFAIMDGSLSLDFEVFALASVY